MARIKKILAIANPLAQSSTADSQPACTRAIQVARVLGADVRLHAVVFEPSANFDLFHIVGKNHVSHQLCDDAQEMLESLKAGFETPDGPALSISSAWDHPFDRGVTKAIETDWPDLVMISAREAGRLSAAEWRLLHDSEIPVWLVRDRDWPQAATIGAFVDPAHREARRSDADAEVMNWSMALHQKLGLVSVVHALHPEDVGDDSENADDSELQAVIHQRREAIQSIIPGDMEPAPDLQIRAESADSVMRDFAGQSDAGLVVMGVFSRTRLKDLLIGSTARNVLPNLPCDVLTVPAGR